MTLFFHLYVFILLNHPKQARMTNIKANIFNSYESSVCQQKYCGAFMTLQLNSPCYSLFILIFVFLWVSSSQNINILHIIIVIWKQIVAINLSLRKVVRVVGNTDLSCLLLERVPGILHYCSHFSMFSTRWLAGEKRTEFLIDRY